MLYNALHIGDQIISIGGITVTNAKEANKIINNSTGQFVSVNQRSLLFESERVRECERAPYYSCCVLMHYF